jgi:cytochrome c oxidase subunit 1
MSIISQNQQIEKHQYYWIISGVFALSIAGLLALILAGHRTPTLEAILPLRKLFFPALVAHVNLSVSIWFLCIASYSWSLLLPVNCFYRYCQLFNICSVLIGIVLISVSGINPHAIAFQNNYIPMMDHDLFIIGLLSSFLGFSLQSLLVISCVHKVIAAWQENHSMSLWIYGSAIAFFVSITASFLTFLQLDPALHAEEPAHYYELLFWPGGHLLQFVYSTLLIVAWWQMLVLSASDSQHWHKAWRFPALLLTPIFTMGAMVSFFLWPVDDAHFIDFYTQHMIFLGGITTSMVMFHLIYKGLRVYYNRCCYGSHFLPSPIQDVAYNAIALSLFLFALGGVIGLMITGMNVTIPAHYHGSVGGITLALMGLVYVVLIQNYSWSISYKNACFQLRLYAFGQCLHALAMAWSGGYGALRKTPGVALSVEAKIGMGFMGLGALLAVIGGIWFVLLILQGAKKEKCRTNNIPLLHEDA